VSRHKDAKQNKKTEQEEITKVTQFINLKTKQNEEKLYIFKHSLVMLHCPGDDDGFSERVG